MDTTSHVVVLPFMAYGHMIPLAEIAALFASRGLKTTLIATPSIADRLAKIAQSTSHYAQPLTLQVIQFKTGADTDVDDPDKLVTSEHLGKLMAATSTLLQEPLEQFIVQSKPNCIVADMLYPWTTQLAAKYHIPRIVFNPNGYFPMCCTLALEGYKPNVSSDSEPFVIPNLPHEIKLAKRQIPFHEEVEGFEVFLNVVKQVMESYDTSYGFIWNSFYDLEPDYADYFRDVLKKKSWDIGPVSLITKTTEEKLSRGRKSTIDEHECLTWLDSKPPCSVIYISFGSLAKVSKDQAYEIAMALEGCDANFIWVVRNYPESFIPEGFEARMKEKGKGLMIKAWAPQVLILEHPSVGGFMSHVGWNAVLEAVSSEVATVTWPVLAETFYHSKLVTDILKIGVMVSEDVQWNAEVVCEGVSREAIQSSITRVMGTKEGDEMRRRARVLKEKGIKAIQEGGSSYVGLSDFIHDIKKFKFQM